MGKNKKAAYSKREEEKAHSKNYCNGNNRNGSFLPV